MPAPRILPDDAELIQMVKRGMTQQEIADEAFKRTGVRVTRAAVSAALIRAGQPPQRPRYPDLLPWRVKAKHDGHYALKMLRVEGRIRDGKPVTDRELKRLEAWKETLQANKAVVHYDPDTEEGFYYVQARPGVDRDLIRVPEQAA